jgi:hypothetical protein
MIPYDDLVVALTAWRARQGLPVARPARVAAITPTAPVVPARPAAPRPAPPAISPELGDFEDGALVEDSSYDAGEDYVMQLGAVEHQVEPTAISGTPEPAPSGKRGKRPDGW